MKIAISMRFMFMCTNFVVACMDEGVRDIAWPNNPCKRKCEDYVLICKLQRQSGDKEHNLNVFVIVRGQ